MVSYPDVLMQISWRFDVYDDQHLPSSKQFMSHTNAHAVTQMEVCFHPAWIKLKLSKSTTKPNTLFQLSLRYIIRKRARAHMI